MVGQARAGCRQREWTDDECRPAVGGGRGHGRRQAKIAMSRKWRGLWGRTNGPAGKAIPPQSHVTACEYYNHKQPNAMMWISKVLGTQ